MGFCGQLARHLCLPGLQTLDCAPQGWGLLWAVWWSIWPIWMSIPPASRQYLHSTSFQQAHAPHKAQGGGIVSWVRSFLAKAVPCSRMQHQWGEKWMEVPATDLRKVQGSWVPSLCLFHWQAWVDHLNKVALYDLRDEPSAYRWALLVKCNVSTYLIN